MSAASRMVTFSREGNTLAVRGTLGLNENDAFYPELMELLKADEKELRLDLRGIDYMSSICIGSIAALITRARQRNVAVAILANGRIGKFLEVAGIGLLCNLRIDEE